VRLLCSPSASLAWLLQIEGAVEVEPLAIRFKPLDYGCGSRQLNDLAVTVEAVVGILEFNYIIIMLN